MNFAFCNLKPWHELLKEVVEAVPWSLLLMTDVR